MWPTYSQNQSILQTFRSLVLRALLGYSGRSASAYKNRLLCADPRWQLYFASDSRQSGLRNGGYQSHPGKMTAWHMLEGDWLRRTKTGAEWKLINVKIKKPNHRVGRHPACCETCQRPSQTTKYKQQLFLQNTARGLGAKLSAVLSTDAATSRHLQQTEQHAALSPIGLSENWLAGTSLNSFIHPALPLLPPLRERMCRWLL